MQESVHVVRVWDLPTRVFHWVLALLAVGLLVTGQIGGDMLVWHARLGYTAGSLLVFRVLWGFVGGHWSRFRAFPPSLRAAAGYWRNTSSGPPGHSPLGALSVYALLLFLIAQVATGLMSADKDDFAGPLTAFVSNKAVHFFTGYHRNIGQWVLIALVVLHLAAVAYYQLRLHRDLVGPMLRGDKAVEVSAPSSRDDGLSRTLALVLFVLSACLFVWISTLGP